MNNFVIRNTTKDQTINFFLGGLLLVIAFLTWEFYIGYILLLLFVLLLLHKTGIEFNTEKLMYRDFFSIPGYTKGVWKSYANCNCLSIKKKKKRMQQYAPRSNSSRVDLKTYYELVLMRSDKRKYKLIFSSKNLEETFKMAELCSKKINLPITAYGN